MMEVKGSARSKNQSHVPLAEASLDWSTERIETTWL